jgi:epoxyqueuosine reductase QueG
MRCQCCNRNLSDYESVLKHPETHEYLDICTKCLKDIPINPLVPDNQVDNVGFEEDFEEIETDFEILEEETDNGD